MVIKINTLETSLKTFTESSWTITHTNTDITTWITNAKYRVTLYKLAKERLSAYDTQLLAHYYLTLNETVSLDQVNLELRVMNLALQKSYDAILVD